MDVVDKATRSRMMSGVRSKNTKPELIVRSFFHRAGLRFRLHGNLPGKPDLVLPKYRAVVFVHGCFWHRHEGCRHAATPKSNALFWQKKFEDNVRRDAAIRKKLESLGWKVFVVWSCELSDHSLASVVTKIRKITTEK